MLWYDTWSSFFLSVVYPFSIPLFYVLPTLFRFAKTLHNFYEVLLTGLLEIECLFVKVLQIFFLINIFKCINAPLLFPSSLPSMSYFCIVFAWFYNLFCWFFPFSMLKTHLLSHLFFSHSVLSLALFPLHVCFLLVFFAANVFFFFFPWVLNCALQSLCWSTRIAIMFIFLAGQLSMQTDPVQNPLVWSYAELRGVGWVAVVRQVQIRASRQRKAPFACKES